MQRRFVFFLLILSSICTGTDLAVEGKGARLAADARVTQGSLTVIGSNGEPTALCPLKRTEVKAEISGFMSRVAVTQEFANPFKEKIEAVYTFPLPSNAAVDDMTMHVGGRTIRGIIKRREEALAIYEAARSAGHAASLLDQQRPNVFTQSVANIMPGEQVKITINYFETLKYEDGSYEFVFPMVVGPRYMPGNPSGKQGGGWAHDTDRVPDASRISPQVAPRGTRAGHDISIEVALDGGVSIERLESVLHEVEIEQPTKHSAGVRLKNRTEIPNRDFILKYDVAGKRVEDALLTHRSDKGGYFAFILQPPERVLDEDITPKELVFVLDTSGSMSGFPIDKAKETMKLALDALRPEDTFNLITFSGNTDILFPAPVPATMENLRKAQAFLLSRTGGGGTEMMKAIRAAMEPSDAQNHIRIVCFMTDGFVGNDLEIISEVKKHPNARIFAFGIGGSVNRFLLDMMAEQGRGDVEYVTLQSDGSAAARRFHQRIRNPLLTDVSIEWSGVTVADVYPKRIPDLFSAKPIVVCGRYTGAGNGVVKLRGTMAGQPFEREIATVFPERHSRNEVLQTFWARRRIDELMSQDFSGIQQGTARDEIREGIANLGLEFRLMTQFTSFVAVEEMVITDGGEPRRIQVPVEMPEGVRYEGVFGGPGNVPLHGALSAGFLGGLGQVHVTTARERPAGPSFKRTSPPPPPPPPPPDIGGRLEKIITGTKTTASPEENKRRELASKLHPSIAAIIDRLQKGDRKEPSAESKFIRNGKAEIQVWLRNGSKEEVDQIKKLGFETLLEPPSKRVIVGRIPIEKLEPLANLESVRYVAPMLAAK